MELAIITPKIGQSLFGIADTENQEVTCDTSLLDEKQILTLDYTLRINNTNYILTNYETCVNAILSALPSTQTLEINYDKYEDIRKNFYVLTQ